MLSHTLCKRKYTFLSSLFHYNKTKTKLVKHINKCNKAVNSK